MTTQDILAIRLHNQYLSRNFLDKPADLVHSFGAVQSQDYAGAKWALGNRLKQDDKQIQEDFNSGKFLRTHVLRPTWHFVHPDDISWMLDLTRDRIKASMRSYNRAMGLNEEIVEKCKNIFENELRSKEFMTRNELADTLNKNNIKWLTNGLSHILMFAELDKVICSGPAKENQQTYTLFSKRVGFKKTLSREEAITELVKRYFLSHGPATVQDFAWWSGLTTADAKNGLEANKSLFISEVVDGFTFYFNKTQIPKIPDKTYLLPNYDEYAVAYKNRDAFFDSKYKSFLDTRGNSIFQNLIITRGIMTGTWKKTLKNASVTIEAKLFNKPDSKDKELLREAVEEYGRFLGMPTEVIFA